MAGESIEEGGEMAELTAYVWREGGVFGGGYLAPLAAEGIEDPEEELSGEGADDEDDEYDDEYDDEDDDLLDDDDDEDDDVFDDEED